jgi:hypothetical protein
MKKVTFLFILVFTLITLGSEATAHKEDTKLSICNVGSINTTKNVLLNDEKRKKKIEIQAGASIDAIWLRYENPLDDWQLHPWVSYSISGLTLFNIVAPFNIETGIRLSKFGNRTNIKSDPRTTIIDLPVIDTSLFDSSQKVYGKTQINIYNASLPNKIIFNLKNFPVSILAGFNIGYSLYADGWIKFEDTNLEDSKEELTKVLNQFNFSYILGMKYQVNRIAIRIEGYWGITNLAKKHEWYSDFNSRDISLSIHYVF